MIEELEKKVIAKRHDEVVSAMKKVGEAVTALSQKEDNELKKLLTDNKEAINNFVKAADSFSKTTPPDQKEVTEAIHKIAGQIGTIMKGIDTRLEALENRPLAVKMKAERDISTGQITYVIIEYQK